jgi:hypothetical protein
MVTLFRTLERIRGVGRPPSGRSRNVRYDGLNLTRPSGCVPRVDTALHVKDSEETGLARLCDGPELTAVKFSKPLRAPHTLVAASLGQAIVSI